MAKVIKPGRSSRAKSASVLNGSNDSLTASIVHNSFHKAQKNANKDYTGRKAEMQASSIRSQFSLPGADRRGEAEALYEYRLGLVEGLNFDWATQRGRKDRRQFERPIAQ